MTPEFLATFEDRVLAGTRAYALSREYPGTAAADWFAFILAGW
jgi:hypothetical protein